MKAPAVKRCRYCNALVRWKKAHARWQLFDLDGKPHYAGCTINPENAPIHEQMNEDYRRVMMQED